MTTYFIDLRADSVGGNPVTDPGDIVIRSDIEQNPNPARPLDASLLQAIQGRDVLLGTHGFHVSRANGIANLSHWNEWFDLGPNGLFVGVLWPGDSRWVPFIDYPFEGDEAIKSGQLLGKYLVAKFLGAATLSFASHSLGARVVLEAIRGLSGSPKLKTLTLMAAAIDDTCLNNEYQDVAQSIERISVLASHCDEVLKWAFPGGNLLSGIITKGEPYWDGALGRYGPNPPDRPSELFGSPVLPDSWRFGHSSYINCSGAVSGPPLESGQFGPLPLVVPSDPQAPLPPGALAQPSGTEMQNWRQAWAAGFVSSRYR